MCRFEIENFEDCWKQKPLFDFLEQILPYMKDHSVMKPGIFDLEKLGTCRTVLIEIIELGQQINEGKMTFQKLKERNNFEVEATNLFGYLLKSFKTPIMKESKDLITSNKSKFT